METTLTNTCSCDLFICFYNNLWTKQSDVITIKSEDTYNIQTDCEFLCFSFSFDSFIHQFDSIPNENFYIRLQNYVLYENNNSVELEELICKMDNNLPIILPESLLLINKTLDEIDNYFNQSPLLEVSSISNECSEICKWIKEQKIEYDPDDKLHPIPKRTLTSLKSNIIRYDTLKLCDDEQDFLKERFNKTKGIRKELNIPDNINISVCTSGGGIRSMLGTLGFLDGLRKTKILDVVQYVGSVSGSTWSLTSALTTPSNPFHNINPDNTINPWKVNEELTNKQREHLGTKNMLAKLNIKKYGISALTKSIREFISKILKRNRPFTLVDIYSLFLGNIFLSNTNNERFNLNYSNLNENINSVCQGDYPLPVCSFITTNTKNDSKWGWVECTPFEVGIIPEKTWIRSENFGNTISSNGFPNNKGDCKIHYLLGLWGSAFAVDLGYIFGDDKTVQDIIDEYFTGFLRPVGYILKKIIPDKVLRISFPRAVGKIQNFTKHNRKYIDARDAGIDINLPFPLFSKQRERIPNVIIVMDASGKATTPKELANAIEKYHLYEFINKDDLDKELKEGEYRIFRPKKDTNTPKIIYIMGNTTKSTFDFSALAEEIDDIINVTYKTIVDNSQDIINEIIDFDDSKRNQ